MRPYKLTGEQEINKLTAHFIKQEEENFALFSYVNELNDELESLQTRMEQLTMAIDEARALNVHRDQEQAENLEKITKELEEQTALADTTEEDLAKVKRENCSKLAGNFVLGLFS